MIECFAPTRWQRFRTWFRRLFTKKVKLDFSRPFTLPAVRAPWPEGPSLVDVLEVNPMVKRDSSP